MQAGLQHACQPVIAGLRHGPGQPVAAHLLLQLLYQLVGLQPIQAKDLVIFQPALVLVEVHRQPLAEKGACRMLHEGGELAQRQRHLGVGHERWQGWRQDLHAGGRVGRGVGIAPFGGMGGQRRAGLEVRPAEGLQWMVRGAFDQQVVCTAPARREVVTQLGHEHRGRLLAVVAHMVPRPADVERAPRGQQGLQHELAVVVAACPVARAVMAGLLHEVEIAAQGTAGVVAIVHAQQAHHLEGDGAHGHERAEGHAPGSEALVQRGLLQRRQPGRLRNCEGHGLGIGGLVAGIQPGHECGLQRVDHGAVRLVTGQEQVLQQLPQVPGPCLRAGVLQALLPPVQQPVQHGGQHASQFGVQPPYFVVGLDTIEGCRCAHLGVQGHGLAAAGVAQQHAAQAEPGTVVLAAGLQP